jgi:hypothetical protein
MLKRAGFPGRPTLASTLPSITTPKEILSRAGLVVIGRDGHKVIGR